MPPTYLITSYTDRETVKALGASWDSAQKQWFVPSGRDLAPFATWLPAIAGSDAVAPAQSNLPEVPPTTEVATTGKGVRLSQLLAGVAQAVTKAYAAGVWTMVDVLSVNLRNGHVYLEVSERDAGGNSVAQARAVI